ncbi:hypothetical protein ACIO13_16005 [Streptomyces sp. NPDC087425]|uniref:hypothetical protein n=1 Tax=Streptomyces sp. NPDC087425 TaxID=3365787 RepID=UPI003804A0CA
MSRFVTPPPPADVASATSPEAPETTETPEAAVAAEAAEVAEVAEAAEVAEGMAVGPEEAPAYADERDDIGPAFVPEVPDPVDGGGLIPDASESDGVFDGPDPVLGW